VADEAYGDAVICWTPWKAMVFDTSWRVPLRKLSGRPIPSRRSGRDSPAVAALPPSRARRDSVRSAKEIATVLPANTWRPLKLREGAKGPIVYEYARVRIWAKRHKEAGPPIWLMFQREIDHPQILRCWVSNAEEAVSLETLAEVASQRVRMEQFFEEAKGEVGVADYEARAWTSWHHHMSLVALAHLFVTKLRLDLRPDERN